MSDTNFNPLDTVQALGAAGVERNHAEAISAAISHANERSARKDDLASEIASVRSEFATIRWVVGLMFVLVLGVYGFFGSLLLGAFDGLF